MSGQKFHFMSLETFWRQLFFLPTHSRFRQRAMTLPGRKKMFNERLAAKGGCDRKVLIAINYLVGKKLKFSQSALAYHGMA